MTTFTAQQISEHVQGELHGESQLAICRLSQFDDAHSNDLTFIGNADFAQRWDQCSASAALIGNDMYADASGDVLEPGAERALIVVADADLAMAKVLSLFELPMPVAGLPASQAADADPDPVVDSSKQPLIHASAIVDETAQLGSGVKVGANAVIGANVVVGSSTIIHANVMLYDESHIGADCVLWPGTMIRERCVIGDRCVFHANVSIGADGFGYLPDPEAGGLVKIPQIGNVIIGNDVEIGSNSCIDRGKFSATEIGDGCKIDNLCQVGHNCKIGKYVILVAQVGVAGSVTIGDGAMLGGHAGIADHLTIGAGAKISAMTGIMADVPAGEYHAGLPGRPARQCFTELAALRKLPKLIKEWKRIQKQLNLDEKD